MRFSLLLTLAQACVATGAVALALLAPSDESHHEVPRVDEESTL